MNTVLFSNCPLQTRSYLGRVLFVALLTVFIASDMKSQSFTVVLDAGHGGRDPGCLGKNSQEKDLALDVTLLAGKKLRALFPQINIIYTRDRDEFIPLQKRAKIANDAQADLFVSIHCNYAPGKPHVVGTETFVMGLHRAASNLEVVKRENAVIELEQDTEVYSDLDPNSPIGHIILENRQHANLDQSIQVASYIQEEFTEGLHRNNRGVKQAGFLVLYHTAMPSVLIELGFLSNLEEEAYCMSKEGQNDLANAISRAIGHYIGQVNPQTKPVFASKKSKNIDEPVSKELPVTYKIQLGASKNKPLHIEENPPWSNIEEFEIVAEQGLYKYLTGSFSTITEARKAKEDCRKKGFSGAFIVAYKGLKRVSLDN